MPAAKVLLLMTNRKGNTVLHEAAKTGIVEMATLMLEKELDGRGDQVLTSVPNINGETAIYWAAMYGHKDMLLFLNINASSRGITRTSTSTSMVGPLTMRTDGSTILHAAVLAKAYDVAMEIMEIWRSWRFTLTLFLIEMYLGATPFALAEYAAAIIYSFIEIENYETYSAAAHKTLRQDSSLKDKFNLYFRSMCKGIPFLKLIYNAKLKHAYAIQLLRKLLEEDHGQWTENYEDPPNGLDDKYNDLENRHPLPTITERPLILATKLGIVEMLKEIIEYIIELLKSCSTNSKKNLDILIVGIDSDGNTPLHAAAKLGKRKPWHIRGAAQWMQWECVWFQRVKRMLPPHMLTLKNRNNQYAYQVYSETHRDLREQGERWVKEGSSNCMLISTLIATVMFASAFTVPGGNDSHSGRPILLENQDFSPFLHYVGLSFFFSLISLGLSLSIHAAAFNEHDFFFRLPLRSVFVVTALFNSITFTICASFQAYMLITGWTGPLVWLYFDIGVASLALLFSANMYVDTVGCFIRYLIDILFI
ncbi:hypothetical protein MKW98_010887 [Papaver atlanticum]|uniref:PGG domain-containing protein n=1 Tax=Papaver atlanticum TaxID=357466 RepID=A0AAD4XH08_9MAGN|nr:hypothetical protein MKW98_010887 [Papaver atlanticum]